MSHSWDYLIVTASNAPQARAYESQLALRHRLGSLPNVRSVLVVADPDGKRVGSGGSTLCCLIEVVNRELLAVSTAPRPSPAEILRKLRILIIHAGGDSRRLPAYGPCGKIFIPVPGEGSAELGCALFDRIAPAFLGLPAGRDGEGQIVMAAGDALILFDPSGVSLAHPGLTALTCPDTPEHASKHGVFCAGDKGKVRLYLQKPNVPEQQKLGAINKDNRSLLDIGVMSFDATLALALFRAYGIGPGANGLLEWSPAMKSEVLARGVDFYREICCAMGSEATASHHFHQCRNAGCAWDEGALREIFSALSGVPFHLETICEARFLHFGTTRQLISSGAILRQQDSASVPVESPLCLDNFIQSGQTVPATKSWIEGCRVSAPLKLEGNNVVIGLDVSSELSLPQGACLDVLSGQSRDGRPVWFARPYGISDTFKDTVAKGGTFCGKPLLEWLAAAGIEAEAIWNPALPPAQRSLWDACVFPAMEKPDDFREWLWFFDPQNASAEQKRAFREADRYSAAEIAVLADQDAFFARRRELRHAASAVGGVD